MACGTGRDTSWTIAYVYISLALVNVDVRIGRNIDISSDVCVGPNIRVCSNNRVFSDIRIGSYVRVFSDFRIGSYVRVAPEIRICRNFYVFVNSVDFQFSDPGATSNTDDYHYYAKHP
jgi:serine acetyltransferase